MADVRNPISLCAGRLVASLPVDAKPTMKATFQYIETQSPTLSSDFQAIKKTLEQEKNDYATTMMHRDARHDAMERAAGYDPDKTYGKTKLVGFREDSSIQQIAIGYHPELTNSEVVSDVYRVVGGTKYTFTSTGFGADSYAKVSATMWSAARNFQPLHVGEVPTAPGFCVAGGMFADDGRQPLHESFTLVAQFKKHPDARFSIDAHAIDRVNTDEPSLKHRVDSELGILRANVDGHVSVLVRGEREVAGQKGYQIGLSVPNDTVPGTTAYKFFWSADGVPDDAQHPFMEVSLTIQPEDGRPASFATADDAKAFWNTLVEGMHIRPGAVRR